MSLAERRAQHKRAVARHKRVLWGYDYYFHPSHIETPKSCSCWMCGNPRRQKVNRSSRLTMQEKIADLREHETEES